MTTGESKTSHSSTLIVQDERVGRSIQFFKTQFADIALLDLDNGAFQRLPNRVHLLVSERLVARKRKRGAVGTETVVCINVL